MSETEVKEKKEPTEYTEVAMEDGRTVKFAGKRAIDKTPLVDEDKSDFGVRFDFKNGRTMTIWASECPGLTQLQSGAHGLAQKCGDEAAGSKTIDDTVAAVEDMMERLRKGEWRTARAAGDSFAGTSVVIRALAEVTGKTAEAVKAFLQGKLEAAKARGESLSRQELYASFRRPGSKTAEVITRLEAEDAAGKTPKVSADDLVAELQG